MFKVTLRTVSNRAFSMTGGSSERRSCSQSMDGSRQMTVSFTCTGSGGGSSFKRKSVAFSDRTGSIPEDGENVVTSSESDTETASVLTGCGNGAQAANTPAQ